MTADYLFHVQNRQMPLRCQASTVAGCTTWSAAGRAIASTATPTADDRRW